MGDFSNTHKLLPSSARRMSSSTLADEEGRQRSSSNVRFSAPRLNMESMAQFENSGSGTMIVINPEFDTITESPVDGSAPLLDQRDDNSEDSDSLPHIDKKVSLESHSGALLGEFASTAICGNDITASILYVGGLVALWGGPLSPICLLLVSAVLWLFRSVYSEACSALPVNGGCYSLLLNTTSKGIASVAACLTLLSYISTAVVSASEAMEYLNNLLPQIPILVGTIAILAIFAFLSIIGISESATVAMFIFSFHLYCMTVLSVLAVIQIVNSPSLMVSNFQMIGTQIQATQCDFVNENIPHRHGSGSSSQLHWANYIIIPVSKALYFGFSSGMLGTSGFETSANFIEEQKPGVFPKTLRNMWIAVSIYNPLMSLLMMGLFDLSDPVTVCLNAKTLLQTMGLRCGGQPLSILIGVDAFLVLCGSTLTGYVGVTGLVRRLALDRVLPKFLLHRNSWRGTNHWIILIFFAVTSSLYLMANGQVSILAGVYSISFLSVMSMYATGNLLLKYKRASLPRDIRASPVRVIFALLMVIVALVGVFVSDPQDVPYFFAYFLGVGIVVTLMFIRVSLLKAVLFFVVKKLKGGLQQTNDSRWQARLGRKLSHFFYGVLKDIKSQKVIFFARDSNLAILNKAAQYVRENEQTDWMQIVVCLSQPDAPSIQVPPSAASETVEDGQRSRVGSKEAVGRVKDDIGKSGPVYSLPSDMQKKIEFLDQCYPKMRIDLVVVYSEFSPETVDRLSELLDCPKNLMFIGCPSSRFPRSISQWGGIRIITH